MSERPRPGEVRRVAIVSNPKVDAGYARRLTGLLEKRGVHVAEVRPQGEPDGVVDPDLVFVLGGDGTMLKAARMYPERTLLGVNLGKVGFMSGMLPDEMEAGVDKVLNGGMTVQEYRMLEVLGVPGTDGNLLAANDAVLLKKLPHQLVSVDLSVGGEHLFSFRCDGFIAATPLGSTAYALSAGGPIISGDVGSFVLVPIAPHALVSRPLVLGEDQKVELTVVDRDAVLSLDGADPVDVAEGAKIQIKLSHESVRIGRTDGWSWWRAVRRTFL